MQAAIWRLTAFIVTSPDKAFIPFPLPCLHSYRLVQNETTVILLHFCAVLIGSEISPSLDESAVAESKF